MDKLISVEYSPAWRNDYSAVDSPLDGCLGETLVQVYDAAVRRHNQLLAESKTQKALRITVPVRFPLLGYNSQLSFWNGDRDPRDIHALREEGIEIPLAELSPSNTTPISLYPGKRMETVEEARRLMGEEFFRYSRNYARLRGLVKHLSKALPFAWSGKHECRLTSGEPPPVFLEARVYGLHTVLGTYDCSSLRGVILEIITRPWPSAQNRADGVVVGRKRHDTYLFSSSKNYVQSVDGVPLKRHSTNHTDIVARISKLIPPQVALKVRHKLDKCPLKSGNSAQSILDEYKYTRR